MRIKSYSVFRLFFVLLVVPYLVFGWGYQTHRVINYYSIKNLPTEMEKIKIYADYLSLHSSDPDNWRIFIPDEQFRHYINLDDFASWPFDKLQKKYENFVERHTAEEVENTGLLPWAVVEYLDLMTVNMKKNRWPEAFVCAYVIGHYIGDAHQPFHTTKNHDGQFTGNFGIHKRYEIELTDSRIKEIKVEKAPNVKYISKPVDFVFEILIKSYSNIEQILDADTKYRKYLGKEPEKYYKLLWEDTKGITLQQINSAIYALSCLWYTAWVNAGRPEIPEIKEDRLLPAIENENVWRQLR